MFSQYFQTGFPEGAGNIEKHFAKCLKPLCGKRWNVSNTRSNIISANRRQKLNEISFHKSTLKRWRSSEEKLGGFFRHVSETTRALALLQRGEARRQSAAPLLRSHQINSEISMTMPDARLLQSVFVADDSRYRV